MLFRSADDPQLDELITRVIKHQSFRRDRIEGFLQRSLIHPLRAIGSLIRYVWQTRTLSETRLQHSASGRSDFAFFNYFAGYESDQSTQVEYRSPYWGDAPNLLKNPDWFHIYPRNVDHLGIELTQREIARLNATSGSTNFLFLRKIHVRDFSQLFRTFFSQRRVHRRFRKKLMSFKTEGSALELWGVFEEEWDDSIIGSTAMRHLILLKTTNNLVREMSQYSKIFYLMENQAWELALIFCVRRHQKGKLIGVAHSTIRFWDLRYFSDESENYFIDSKSRRPSPDRILVNGEIGKQLLLNNHYPASSISVVEALRYMYLQDLQPAGSTSTKHVLLLGDFLESANSVLVSVFRKALDIIDNNLLIKVRSHPICPLTDLQLGKLTKSISVEKLSDLLERASVVITTAASSSAAESAALGIPTIVVLDARSLNYSPFRQSGNVYVVENASQLAELLRDVSRLDGRPTESIFCLDPNYSRWQTEFSLN